MSVGAFLQEIKRHLVKTDGDKATESIFLFVAANSMPPSNWLMSQVYEKHKNEDGFLCKFGIEYREKSQCECLISIICRSFLLRRERVWMMNQPHQHLNSFVPNQNVQIMTGK
jgi:hypothetical protein